MGGQVPVVQRENQQVVGGALENESRAIRYDLQGQTVSGDTGRLYLDQLQALGVEGSGTDRGYPPLTKVQMDLIEVIADNLFLFRSTLAWACFDAMTGKSDSFKTIRERLLSPPVKMVRAD